MVSESGRREGGERERAREIDSYAEEDYFRQKSKSFRAFPTKNWHLPSVLSRVKSLATAVADLQHPLKGVQESGMRRSGMRHSVL